MAFYSKIAIEIENTIQDSPLKSRFRRTKRGSFPRGHFVSFLYTGHAHMRIQQIRNSKSTRCRTRRHRSSIVFRLLPLYSKIAIETENNPKTHLRADFGEQSRGTVAGRTLEASERSSGRRYSSPHSDNKTHTLARYSETALPTETRASRREFDVHKRENPGAISHGCETRDRA